MTSSPLAAPRAAAAESNPLTSRGAAAHAHDHGHDHGCAPARPHGSPGTGGQATRPAPARPPASLLRLSAGARLAGATFIAAGIWLGVLWAMQ